LVVVVDASGLQPTNGSARHATNRPETHLFVFTEKRMTQPLQRKFELCTNRKSDCLDASMVFDPKAPVFIPDLLPLSLERIGKAIATTAGAVGQEIGSL
jgi:hypothetical protein